MSKVTRIINSRTGEEFILGGEGGVPEDLLAEIQNLSKEITEVSDVIGHDENLNSFALGGKSKVKGENAVAMGLNCEANGKQSVAIGTETKAVGNHSFASGYQTQANNQYDHVEGFKSIAQGKASHAEGSHTEAIGRDSHAEGVYNKAIGIASHAEGEHNIAKNQAQHVSGKYATIDESGNAIFQVGAGTDENNRKDVFKVNTDGSIEIQDTEGNPFILQKKLDNLQKQIDGETSTWFFGGVPSPDTAPANEWTDDTLKKRHTGDVYINTLPLEADLTSLDANVMSIWFESGTLDIDSSEKFESQRVENTGSSRTKVLFELKDEEVTINFPITLSCRVIYYYANGSVIKNISNIINANSITLLKSTPLRKYFALVIERGINFLSRQILQATTCDHTFTNIYAGKAWRWVEKDYHANDYHWCPIADSDAVKALAASNENKKSIQENSGAIESLGEEVAELQEQIGGIGEITPAFTDVSLYAYTEKGWSYDNVFVKAPAGMLKETDQVIFARYISNRTRPRLNGMTDKSTPRSVYRGWIKPARGGKHNSQLHMPDDILKLVYFETVDDYDQFELRVYLNDYDESLLCYLWEYASVDEVGYRHPRVKDKKLGIKIVRDGKTIVDYLTFTIKVDYRGCVHFGRL